MTRAEEVEGENEGEQRNRFLREAHDPFVLNSSCSRVAVENSKRSCFLASFSVLTSMVADVLQTSYEIQ